MGRKGLAFSTSKTLKSPNTHVSPVRRRFVGAMVIPGRELPRVLLRSLYSDGDWHHCGCCCCCHSSSRLVVLSEIDCGIVFVSTRSRKNHAFEAANATAKLNHR
jgi:hypothetical protein